MRTLYIIILIIFFFSGCKEKSIQNNVSESTKTLQDSIEKMEKIIKEKEADLKNKEAEIKDLDTKTQSKEPETTITQKQNIESPKNNINFNIIDGRYQVGNTYCTISTVSNSTTVRWAKGTGSTNLRKESQGNKIVYNEYNKGEYCGSFYFDEPYKFGNYTRFDNKNYIITKVK
jgi:hypothetical protein